MSWLLAAATIVFAIPVGLYLRNSVFSEAWHTPGVPPHLRPMHESHAWRLQLVPEARLIPVVWVLPDDLSWRDPPPQHVTISAGAEQLCCSGPGSG